MEIRYNTVLCAEGWEVDKEATTITEVMNSIDAFLEMSAGNKFTLTCDTGEKLVIEFKG